jgi:hypothetical protein
VAIMSCPECGLTLSVARGRGDVEHCPRCLARTRGAVSVALVPGRAKAHAGLRQLISRVLPQRWRHDEPAISGPAS